MKGKEGGEGKLNETLENRRGKDDKVRRIGLDIGEKENKSSTRKS